MLFLCARRRKTASALLRQGQLDVRVARVVQPQVQMGRAHLPHVRMELRVSMMASVICVSAPWTHSERPRIMVASVKLQRTIVQSTMILVQQVRERRVLIARVLCLDRARWTDNVQIRRVRTATGVKTARKVVLHAQTAPFACPTPMRRFLRKPQEQKPVHVSRGRSV